MDAYTNILAESVAVIPTGGGSSKLVIFKPSAETVKRLKSFKLGQDMGNIVITDAWDDGTYDTHISDRKETFANLLSSGDARKTHTYILTVFHDE